MNSSRAMKKCNKKSRVDAGSLYTTVVATLGSQSRNVTGSRRSVEQTRLHASVHISECKKRKAVMSLTRMVQHPRDEGAAERMSHETGLPMAVAIEGS
jgi:hypothetical protein